MTVPVSLYDEIIFLCPKGLLDNKIAYIFKWIAEGGRTQLCVAASSALMHTDTLKHCMTHA